MPPAGHSCFATGDFPRTVAIEVTNTDNHSTGLALPSTITAKFKRLFLSKYSANKVFLHIIRIGIYDHQWSQSAWSPYHFFKLRTWPLPPLHSWSPTMPLSWLRQMRCGWSCCTASSSTEVNIPTSTSRRWINIVVCNFRSLPERSLAPTTSLKAD